MEARSRRLALRLACLRMGIDDSEVGPSHEDGGGDEDGKSDRGRGDRPSIGSGQTPSDEGHESDRSQHREEICKLQAERESESHLPCDYEPAAKQRRRTHPAIAAEKQEEGEWDAPARNDVQMAILQSFQGAYANAAPAAAAPIHPIPISRANRYAPRNAGNMRLGRECCTSRAPREGSPAPSTGGCVSDERVERERVVIRPNVFACHRSTGACRSAWPIHATCHAWSRGSPRSFPTSLPRWSTSGHDIPTAKATPPNAARAASRRVNSPPTLAACADGSSAQLSCSARAQRDCAEDCREPKVSLGLGNRAGHHWPVLLLLGLLCLLVKNTGTLRSESHHAGMAGAL